MSKIIKILYLTGDKIIKITKSAIFLISENRKNIKRMSELTKMPKYFLKNV